MTDQPKTPESEKMSAEDYENLLDRYQFSTKEFVQGQIVRGRVLKTTPTHVLVDIGFKTEGAIPVEDFDSPEEAAAIPPGSELDAVLDRADRKGGYILLSKRQADAMKALDELEKAFAEEGTVTGMIRERTRGGFHVDLGIKAFLPESHADIKPIRDANALLGKTFKFRVIKFDRRSENAVVSRRLLLQDEREKRKQKVFSTLAVGQTVKGQVRSLTSFGAFVDIGGIEGLLHVSDMSWGKVGHPSELLQAGQEIEVAILDFREKDERISLGLKQLTPDPWQDIQAKYPAGTRVAGKVVSLTDFGAFVELEKGVEGLVHISDLTWSRKLVHPKKILTPGQEVEVQILDVNPTAKRISLGLKQATPHPLETFRQEHGIGSRVQGAVTSLTDFGAFVEVDKGIEGLVHISDISWEKIKHPSEKLKAGDTIEVLILNIDVEKQKVSLGMKQLEGDIWEDFFERTRVGDIVHVKIVRITDFGVFVELLPGIEGVVFLSELDERKIERPAEVFKVGEEKNAKIIKMTPKAKKISLSFRQAQHEIQKMEFQRYMETQDPRMTLGDIMRDQLKNIGRGRRSRKQQEEPHD